MVGSLHPCAGNVRAVGMFRPDTVQATQSSGKAKLQVNPRNRDRRAPCTRRGHGTRLGAWEPVCKGETLFRSPLAQIALPQIAEATLFQPDDAGELADFFLLVFAELETTAASPPTSAAGPLRSPDRSAMRWWHPDWLGARCGSCAATARSAGLHRGPIGFLRGREFQPILDAGDLSVAQSA